MICGMRKSSISRLFAIFNAKASKHLNSGFVISSSKLIQAGRRVTELKCQLNELRKRIKDLAHEVEKTISRKRSLQKGIDRVRLDENADNQIVNLVSKFEKFNFERFECKL